MGKSKEFINNQIIKYYPTSDSTTLASRLGITVAHLRVKAKRLGVRKIRVNEIIDGKKKCPHCGLMKSVEAFNRDKYQCNFYDYYCRSCRAILKKIEERNDARRRGIAYEGSLAFNKGKSVNEIVYIADKPYLRCKSCEVLNPIEEFNVDRKNKTSGHRNTCRTCEALKRRGLI